MNEGRNIVLIGMPGCGKTTIGEALAALAQRPFFDTDHWVESQTGMRISQLISTRGEPAFREWESRAVKEAARQAGNIIATGGGTPLREENRAALKRNGFILLLERELSLLCTEGRPLSGDVAAMYALRAPIYHAFADGSLRNDSNIARVAKRGLAFLEKQGGLLRT